MRLFKNLLRKTITAPSPEPPAQRDVRSEVTRLILQLGPVRQEEPAGTDQQQAEIVRQLAILLRDSTVKSILTPEDIVFILDQLAQQQLINLDSGRLLAIPVQDLLVQYADNFQPGMDLMVTLEGGRNILLLSTNATGDGLNMGVADSSITATQINSDYQAATLLANVVKLMRMGAIGFHLQTPPSNEA